eukprot:gnl/MRDRNA2_/MRDRNA2_58958_c0_seq1.p1 gnl/MRDRNA2_/MRDRNA2_58958_c0~~gnl/MRDRNA2_/MRDRNA2_58958_c0_seq1.p1  ORF type:complete len:250 (+),score=46.16 gnl/MRDRNA2_/MRDRNA2_58958_c0_seq1:57-752(+)
MAWQGDEYSQASEDISLVTHYLLPRCITLSFGMLDVQDRFDVKQVCHAFEHAVLRGALDGLRAHSATLRESQKQSSDKLRLLRKEQVSVWKHRWQRYSEVVEENSELRRHPRGDPNPALPSASKRTPAPHRYCKARISEVVAEAHLQTVDRLDDASLEYACGAELAEVKGAYAQFVNAWMNAADVEQDDELRDQLTRIAQAPAAWSTKEWVASAVHALQGVEGPDDDYPDL